MDLNKTQIRYKPHKLLSYEALFRNLHYKYRFNKTLQTDYQRYKAGFFGEKSMDYKLSLFPSNNFFHFPDLNLKNYNNHFQIDSLIITPKLIFILEAKNLKGLLEYHSKLRQLIQIDVDNKTSYKDPLLQAETQKKHLTLWLQQFGYQIPIEPLVVSTNPYTIIHNVDNDKEFNHRFVTLENLLFKIDEIYNSYEKHILQRSEIQELYKKIIANNDPVRADLIRQYQVKGRHLISGIICDECHGDSLKRKNRTWKCPKCQMSSSNSHVRKILDYFLLHKTFITNELCRKLLTLSPEEQFISYRILKSLNLKTVGNKKGRKYLSPEIWQFPQDAEPNPLGISILD